MAFIDRPLVALPKKLYSLRPTHANVQRQRRMAEIDTCQHTESNPQ